MKKITVMLVVFACLGVLLFSTCKKETTSAIGSSAMAVRLKDAPGNWDRCMVEIKGLRFFQKGKGWITFPLNDTTIDILKLQDTSLLLGTINLDAGTITEVDLILGTRDSITVDGATFIIAPLAADSNDISINVSDTLLPGGSFTMILDLNADQFVMDDGHGHYHWHNGLGCLFGRNPDNPHGF